VPLVTKQVPANGRWCSIGGWGGNPGPGRKWWQPTAGIMASVTCGLTVEDRDHLRNYTLVSSWVYLVLQECACIWTNLYILHDICETMWDWQSSVCYLESTATSTHSFPALQ